MQCSNSSVKFASLLLCVMIASAFASASSNFFDRVGEMLDSYPCVFKGGLQAEVKDIAPVLALLFTLFLVYSVTVFPTQ